MAAVRRFTDAETRALLHGVIRFGRKWEKILNHPDYVDVFVDRTGNDLLWRFRNIERSDQIRINTPAAPIINPEGSLEVPGIQVPAPVVVYVGPPRRYVYWTTPETDALYDAVAKHGTRWKVIKEDPQFADSLVNKDKNQLKSKWYNLGLAMKRVAQAALERMDNGELVGEDVAAAAQDEVHAAAEAEVHAAVQAEVHAAAQAEVQAAAEAEVLAAAEAEVLAASTTGHEERLEDWLESFADASVEF